MPFYIVRSKHADEVQTIEQCDLVADVRVISVHDDKASALAVREPNQTVIFRATEDQTDEWQRRERIRFRDGTYSRVPWSNDIYDSCKHFPHLSTVHPGLIAYTPDDDHGVNDRQVRTTVQKYFAKFLSAHGVSKTKIDHWSQQVKAFDGKLKIARTAEEIVNVYTHGPDSCMAHAAEVYACKPHHPCEVYGDSDLGVAYLGDLIAGVSARAIVWPEKKVYGRIYGDETLAHVLHAAGYTQSPWFDGARVRAIEDRNKNWIMPYTDIACSARLKTIDGMQWFVLSSKDSSDWGTRDICGLLSCDDRNDYDEEEDATDCERCGENNCYGVEICDSCRDTRWGCAECRDCYYDDSNDCDDSQSPTRLQDHHGSYRSLCDGCLSNVTETCDVCQAKFYPSVQFSPEVILDRESRGVERLCITCEPLYAYCAPCDWYYKHDGSDVHCLHRIPINPDLHDKPIVTPPAFDACDTRSNVAVNVGPVDGRSYQLLFEWDGTIRRYPLDDRDSRDLDLTLTDYLPGILRSSFVARETVGEWITPMYPADDPDDLRYRYPAPVNAYPYAPLVTLDEVSRVR